LVGTGGRYLVFLDKVDKSRPFNLNWLPLEIIESHDEVKKVGLSEV
jgi:hypothetical protein